MALLLQKNKKTPCTWQYGCSLCHDLVYEKNTTPPHSYSFASNHLHVVRPGLSLKALQSCCLDTKQTATYTEAMSRLQRALLLQTRTHPDLVLALMGRAQSTQLLLAKLDTENGPYWWFHSNSVVQSRLVVALVCTVHLTSSRLESPSNAYIFGISLSKGNFSEILVIWNQTELSVADPKCESSVPSHLNGALLEWDMLECNKQIVLFKKPDWDAFMIQMFFPLPQCSGRLLCLSKAHAITPQQQADL